VRIEKLIDILFYKYKEDPDKNYFIEMLKHNYRHDILSEAAIDTRYTTYTIDKNDMHVCLRTRDKEEKLYDVNLLMYVVLHELAHLCNYDRQKNPIQGHGKEFKDIFKFLVKEAINIGVYDYANYSEKPVEYCNILISSQIYTKS
jgi:predicted metal-dependent hydrolase